MTSLTQVAPNTNPGTLSKSELDPVELPAIQTIGDSDVTQTDLNRFTDLIVLAKNQPVTGDMPEVEVPKRIMEYYNKGKMKGIEATGYFTYNGVRVYEKGTKATFKAKESVSLEERLHGK